MLWMKAWLKLIGWAFFGMLIQTTWWISSYLCASKLPQKHVPPRQKGDSSSKGRRHWIPRCRRILMRNRKRVTRQLVTTQSVTHREALNKRLIEIEKQLQASHAAQAKDEEQKAVEKIDRNNKYFFSCAKWFSKIVTGIGPLLNAVNEFVASPKDMAEILSEQYSSIFSQPRLGTEETEKLFTERRPLAHYFWDINFSEKDLKEAMSEVPINSASGPDGFPAILLRKCSGSLAHPLYIIWRKSMNQGIIPKSCKCANIIPIHKGKSRAEAKNYRPVALTFILIKTFEKVVRKHIVSFLEEHLLFNAGQHGFRAAHSCLSQLLAHFDVINNNNNNNNNNNVSFL